MNRRGVSIQSLAISATMFIITLLVSPFLFELLSVSGVGGVEGFMVKLFPFLMLFFALRAGAFWMVNS